MRVSQQFNLGKAQSELEFVDVDVMNDTKLFIMPSALLGIHTPWAEECRTIIHDFFQELLVCITQNEEKANQLLYFLQKEPNETHLGLSRGVSQGRTLDSENSSQIRDMLLHSEAIRTKMINDLEDTAAVLEARGIRQAAAIGTAGHRDAGPGTKAPSLSARAKQKS